MILETLVWKRMGRDLGMNDGILIAVMIFSVIVMIVAGYLNKKKKD